MGNEASTPNEMTLQSYPVPLASSSSVSSLSYPQVVSGSAQADEIDEESIPSSRDPISLIIIGAGNRGTIYSNFALDRPDLCQVIGVAEPVKKKRDRLVEAHSNTIKRELIFKDWKDVLINKPKVADVAVITTLDQFHLEPALAAANKGYHILLEKPMAPDEEECSKIAAVIKSTGVIFGIGHVLRYTPYTKAIKDVIDSGEIGDVINIQHLEPVGFWHFAHSYVRGNWRREADTGGSLLAKSCHDIDWLLYVMNKKLSKVSSFGSRAHFKPSAAPTGATSRCLDCPVEKRCAYSAKKIYIDPVVKYAHQGFPANVAVDALIEQQQKTTSSSSSSSSSSSANTVVDVENITEAIKTGPYGRCVYSSDNDVCDNQVVNFEFEDGATASFTMVAFTEEICVRKTRIFGTRGELVADGRRIRVYNFAKRGYRNIDPLKSAPRPVSRLSGHGYADYYLMKRFISAVIFNDQSKLITTPDDALRSHRVVFAAEKARKSQSVVDVSSLFDAQNVLPTPSRTSTMANYPE